MHGTGCDDPIPQPHSMLAHRVRTHSEHFLDCPAHRRGERHCMPPCSRSCCAASSASAQQPSVWPGWYPQENASQDMRRCSDRHRTSLVSGGSCQIGCAFQIRTSRYRRPLQMARIAMVAAWSPMLVSATGLSSRTCKAECVELSTERCNGQLVGFIIPSDRRCWYAPVLPYIIHRMECGAAWSPMRVSTCAKRRGSSR